jgi:hypothetical protein
MKNPLASGIAVAIASAAMFLAAGSSPARADHYGRYGRGGISIELRYDSRGGRSYDDCDRYDRRCDDRRYYSRYRDYRDCDDGYVRARYDRYDRYDRGHGRRRCD